ncbi:hypothetical protein SAMN04488003_12162 [Loktanella fryxellensis]|uniref:Membrane-bound lysozyme-inhibitor of c-type lysozyme n=1 Tax=Loktanella fryxellensis TaxID=245187 RepID=A0A1H8HML8_9RHOB|nr:hypothetical protein [Loktanella fryxellensis]SEN57460.1 hypothetical protein SAMN04488003_12162 [Loktanella fryxellensis]
MRHLFPCLIALCLTAGAATAQSCGPQNDKIITIEPRGLVPDIMYFCDGQGVRLLNNAGRAVTFMYRDSAGVNRTYSSLANGQSVGTFTWATTLWNIRTSQVNIEGGEVRKGMAPNSY